MHFVSCYFYFKSISLYNSDIRMIYWLMHQWAIASIYESAFPFVRGGQLDFQQGMLQFLVDFLLIIKKVIFVPLTALSASAINSEQAPQS